MARVFTEGFEWNTLSSTTIPTGTVDNASSSGSVAMESSIVRSGAFSLKLTPASGAAGWWDPSISFGTAAGYLRFYVRVTNFELRVNGQTEIPATLVSGESPPALGLRFGAADTVAATYTAYIDDVALNDTTGANQ